MAVLDANVAGAFLRAGRTFSGRDAVAIGASLSLLDLGSAEGGASFLLFLVWIGDGDGAVVSDRTTSGGMEGDGVRVSKGATWD